MRCALFCLPVRIRGGRNERKSNKRGNRYIASQKLASDQVIKLKYANRILNVCRFLLVTLFNYDVHCYLTKYSLSRFIEPPRSHSVCVHFVICEYINLLY